MIKYNRSFLIPNVNHVLRTLNALKYDLVTLIKICNKRKVTQMSILRVVDTVACANELGELCPPLVLREVLGVGVAGPDALENDLVLGLVAGTARLNNLFDHVTFFDRNWNLQEKSLPLELKTPFHRYFFVLFYSQRSTAYVNY